MIAHRTSLKFLAIFTGLGLVSQVFAQSAETTYQGQLESGGVPANGVHGFVFRLCSTAAGPGGVLQTFPPAGTVAVNVDDGLFTQELTFNTAHFSGAECWLEVEVNGTPLAPRQRLTYAPYATAAKSLILPFAGAGNAGAIFDISNASTASGSMAIRGTSTSASNNTYGVYGVSSSPSGAGVQGVATAATGTNYGGRFQCSSTDGRAVYGHATAAMGFICGGQFVSDSTQGTGVSGVSTHAGFGITYGVHGRASSTQGRGVYGDALSTDGIAVGGYFRSASTGGRGVFAHATASSGDTYGGEFVSDSSSGIGVQGSARDSSGTNYGVYGESDSTSGRGVYGLAHATSGTTYGGRFDNHSTSGRGVFAYATAGSGTTYGVRGQADGLSGYGVYAIGNLGASGMKSFVIDHPSDPENKYLKHYCAEGPQPMNQYSGNVVTDAEGVAWVDLPEYFEEINRDFRYVLTVVDEGDDFVQAKVWRKISKNRFAIRTSRPAVEVSWEVKAVRNDVWVRTHGAPVEVDKVGIERGKYQHPELHGQPLEMGMDYQQPREKNQAEKH